MTVALLSRSSATTSIVGSSVVGTTLNGVGQRLPPSLAIRSPYACATARVPSSFFGVEPRDKSNDVPSPPDELSALLATLPVRIASPLDAISCATAVGSPAVADALATPA